MPRRTRRKPFRFTRVWAPFFTEDDTLLTPACQRAGIPAVGWHAFRYTFATWADASGESLKALQAQMGHTDSRLTLGVYAQPMPEQQRRISGKVAGRLFPTVPKFAPEPENGKALIQ